MIGGWWERQLGASRRSLDFEESIRSRTTHLIFAGILTFGASDAQNRRGLGSNSIDSLEAWGLGLLRVKPAVADIASAAACKRVTDRHGLVQPVSGGVV